MRPQIPRFPNVQSVTAFGKAGSGLHHRDAMFTFHMLGTINLFAELFGREGVVGFTVE